MDTKLVLLKCILLLYWESKAENPLDNSSALVKKIIDKFKSTEGGFGSDDYVEVINNVKNTAAWMAGNSCQHRYDRATLLSRLRVNCAKDNELYTAFETALVETDDRQRISLYKDDYLSDLLTYQERSEIVDLIKTANRAVTYDDATIDWGTFIPEFKGKLEPYTGNAFEAVDSAIVDLVNLSDISSVASAVRRGLEESGAEGIMSTRWQGVNRMFGEYGGMRRGDFIVVGALQHNYKTGFTLEIFRQVAMYSTPYLRDENKKPMLLHISTENSVKDNILQLYVTLKGQETGERIEIPKLSAEAIDNPELFNEIASYVKERMERNGYKVEMVRVDPSQFTYQKLFKLINKYEAKGYEIALLVIDYLNMMSKEGCVTGATGSDVRDLFRRVRNYCNPRGITVLTPHQISSEAKNILRMGTQSFVKEIANKGYWDGCRVIDQEVDMEILIHIEKVDGVSYLTIHRGKHRKVGITPEEDLYTVYKFHPVLGIPEDVGSTDMSRRRVAGNPVSQGGGAAWHDFNAAA